MVPQGQLQPPPLFACGKIYPRAARNGLIAPRGRRRDDELGPWPAKRVFAETMHLRQMASAVDVSDFDLLLVEQGRDPRAFRESRIHGRV